MYGIVFPNGLCRLTLLTHLKVDWIYILARPGTIYDSTIERNRTPQWSLKFLPTPVNIYGLDLPEKAENSREREREREREGERKIEREGLIYRRAGTVYDSVTRVLWVCPSIPLNGPIYFTYRPKYSNSWAAMPDVLRTGTFSLSLQCYSLTHCCA